jgi:excisionase family DNA binding protein
MSLHIHTPAIGETANEPSPAAQRAAANVVAASIPTPQPVALLTVPEILARLRISRKTLYDHVRQKKIPAIKLGRRVLFNWTDVEAALRRLQPQSQ